MRLEEKIKYLDCYTHQEIISKIESESNLNSFYSIIEITRNDTRHRKTILLHSKVTRNSFLCWNFECGKNGLIRNVYVDKSLFN